MSIYIYANKYDFIYVFIIYLNHPLLSLLLGEFVLFYFIFSHSGQVLKSNLEKQTGVKKSAPVLPFPQFSTPSVMFH